jgi:hypothetical protein
MFLISQSFSDQSLRFINFLLTALFLWPLLQSSYSSIRLRRLATRTLVYAPLILSRLAWLNRLCFLSAAVMALTTSTVCSTSCLKA